MSSTEVVKEQIRLFLRSEEREVLCMSGPWGSGKTFTWDRLLKEEIAKARVLPKRYSYISLFGLKNIDEVKIAITEKMDDVDISEKQKGNLGWFGLNKLSREKRAAAQHIPQIQKYLGAYDYFMFSKVKDQLICIDDIERRSKDIRLEDLFGLISSLNEHRDCKIALLLNSDELDEESRESYYRHSEKVIDINLKFCPTAAENAALVFDKGREIDAFIIARCVTLDINNIRVLQKIAKYIAKVERDLADFDPRIFEQACHSIVLFCACKFLPGGFPSIDFLHRAHKRGYVRAEEDNQQEMEWRELLRSYNFTAVDQLDIILLNLIEDGYYSQEFLLRAARDLMAKHRYKSDEERFHNAWELVRSSFADNEDEVVEELVQSVKSAVHVVSPSNLSETIKLLKELSRKDEAQELLSFFMANRDEEEKFWDCHEQFYWRKENPDEDVKAAFSERFAEFQADVDPVTTLQRLGSGKSWNDEDIKMLATMSEDEIYEIFKSLRGEIFKDVVNGAVFFFQMWNPKPEEAKFNDLVRSVLIRIGQENPLNRKRVLWRKISPEELDGVTEEV